MMTPLKNDLRKNLLAHLYVQVLIAVLLGVIVGTLWPAWGASLKWLGDLFIDIIRVLIGPVIFCTVVLGVAGGDDLKKAGRVGFKALLYFEVLSTFALAIGLIIANVLKPGADFHANVASLDTSLIADYTTKAQQGTSFVEMLRHVVPKTFFEAFSGNGDLIQILFIAVLFGYGVHKTGEHGHKVLTGIEAVSKIFFAMVAVVMRLAPIGAFGAMAFTIGKFGLSSLGPLLKLMGVFYLSCLIFVLGVLGTVARLMGFKITRFLLYIKDELLTILATSSSESALVPLMEKLERLGCSKAVVGLVVPAGYSFNLDGTNIYLTLAALFIAQATGVDLSLTQQLSLLFVAILTSKGASGVTGAGFITLAATMMVVPSIPVAGLTLILGIDRFMSEARALTNAIGNGVATIVVARWEGELDAELLRKELL